MFDARHYLTRDGQDLIADWLLKLPDVQGRAAIIRRLNRLEQGAFGDFKPVREGVHELRIDVAPATGSTTPDPARRLCCSYAAAPNGLERADIDRARELWRDWQSRPG